MFLPPKNKKKVYESLYNVQFTVDYDSKMILHASIADALTDHNQLMPMVENLVNIYGLKQLQESMMSWDSAYGTGEALNYLEEKTNQRIHTQQIPSITI